MNQTDDTAATLDDHESPNTRSGLLKQLLFGLLLVGVFSAIVLVRSRPAPTPDVFREGVTLMEALDLASDQGKPVFAVVTADWCGPCQNYKRTALADEGVQAWLAENTVAVMLDADRIQRNEAMLLNFGGSIPATALLIDGRTVGTLEGRANADTLMNWLTTNTGG